MSGKGMKDHCSGSVVAAVAQLVERLLGKEQVEGSNPSRGSVLFKEFFEGSKCDFRSTLVLQPSDLFVGP